jgi:hypothetical protein
LKTLVVIEKNVDPKELSVGGNKRRAKKERSEYE